MKFMFLGIMSAESVSNMHATSHDKRRKMAEIVAAGAGGNVLDMMFCQGVYDMVAVMDLPDASSAIGAKAAVLASGAYSTVDILSEFDLDQAERSKSAYRPAIARSVASSLGLQRSNVYSPQMALGLLSSAVRGWVSVIT